MVLEAQKQLNGLHRQKEAHLQTELEKCRLAQREALALKDLILGRLRRPSVRRRRRKKTSRRFEVTFKGASARSETRFLMIFGLFGWQERIASEAAGREGGDVAAKGGEEPAGLLVSYGFMCLGP